MKIKKIVSIITLASFVLSSVCGQTLYAVLGAPIVPEKITSGLEDFVIPRSYGRITDAKLYGSKQIVINIQDLHCHPEVQRNIAKILSLLDKKHNLKNVYVEGGYGNVSTSWICDVKDKEVKKEITEKLVDQGRLTGAEYYSALSDRPDLLKGLENEAIHKVNIVRLGEILEKKPYFEQKLKAFDKQLEFMKVRYFSSKNRSLNDIIEKHSAGEITTEKYYALLSRYVKKINEDPARYNTLLTVSLENYPNIKTYLELDHIAKQLRYKRISNQLQEFVQLLKSKLPYRAYQSLLKKTDNFANLDEVYTDLAQLSKKYNFDLSDTFPDLQKYFKYAEKSKKLNPINLIQEEKRLVAEIRIGFSRDKNELEVSFLADFTIYFKDYLLNTLSAEDYKYFVQCFNEFKSVWNKYAPDTEMHGLEKDFKVLNEFYAANCERNNCFAKNIPLSGSANKSEIIVVVAGGFHTEGLKELLQKKKISYFCVTPNVTKDTAASSVTYTELAKQQAKLFGSQALALALGSTDAKVISVTSHEIVVKLEEEIISFSRDGNNKLKLSGPVTPGMNIAAIESAVNEAFETTSKIQAFANPLLTSELIYQMVKLFSRWGAREGIFGGNGLIWSIASNPKVQSAISEKEDMSPDEVSQLTEYFQTLLQGHALNQYRLESIAKKSPLLSAIISVPGMQTFFKKPKDSVKRKNEILLSSNEMAPYNLLRARFIECIHCNEDMQESIYPRSKSADLPVMIRVVKGHTLQCEDGQKEFFRIEKMGSMTSPGLAFIVSQGFMEILIQQNQQEQNRLISQAVGYGLKRYIANGIYHGVPIHDDFNKLEKTISNFNSLVPEYKELITFISEHIDKPLKTKSLLQRVWVKLSPFQWSKKNNVNEPSALTTEKTEKKRLLKIIIESIRQAAAESRSETGVTVGEREALIAKLVKMADQYLRYSLDFVNAATNYLPPDNVTFNMSNKGIVDPRTSPTNIGLYLESVMYAWKLGRLDKEEALDRISNTLNQIQDLEKYETKDEHGNVIKHLYNWYSITGDCDPDKRFVSAVDNGNFVASLIVVESALKEMQNGEDVAKIVHEMIKTMNLKVFYNKDSGLLRTGLERQADGTYEQVPGSYNTLGSEARTSYLVLNMQNQGNKDYLDAWTNLYRQLPESSDDVFRATHDISIKSWTGTMFEHLLSELFARVKGSPIDKANKRVILEQIRENCGGILTTLFGKKIGRILQAKFRVLEILEQNTGAVWGTSEAGTALPVGYAAVGNKAAAMHREYTEEELGCSVVVPYASLMALISINNNDRWGMSVLKAVVRNAINLENKGLSNNKYGFCESYAVTRKLTGYRYEKFDKFYGHHKNMAYLAVADFLLRERTEGTPDWFLNSSWNENDIVQKLVNTELDKYKGPKDPLPKTSAKPIDALIEMFDLTRFFGNGTYFTYPGYKDGPSVACMSPSTGISHNRIIYIKDQKTGKVLCAGLDNAINIKKEDGYISYFYKLDLDETNRMFVKVKMAVGTEDNVEKWDIEINSDSSEERNITVTPYLEWVTGDINQFMEHRVYHEMHIETQCDESSGIITAHGPEADNGPVGWICFGNKDGAEVDDWGTNRLEIIGRLRDSKTAIGIENGILGKGRGFTLAPAAALAKKIKVVPGKVAGVTVLTGAAGTTKEAKAVAGKYRKKEFKPSSGPAVANDYLPKVDIFSKVIELSKRTKRSIRTRGFAEKELTEFDVFKHSLKKTNPVHAILICGMLGISQAELQGMNDTELNQKLIAINEKQTKKAIERAIRNDSFAILEQALSLKASDEWGALSNEDIVQLLKKAKYDTSYFYDTDENGKALLRQDARDLFDMLRQGRKLSEKNVGKVSREFLNAILLYSPAAPVYRFSENGKVCKLFKPKSTKKPWAYPDSNGIFGFVATVSGSFFAFGKNSQQLRTTIYNPNIVTEGVMSGIMMEFTNLAGEKLFGSLTPNPQAFENCTYEVEVSRGYIRYILKHNNGLFKVTTTRFVAKEGKPEEEIPVGFAKVDVECEAGCRYQLITYNKFDTNGSGLDCKFDQKTCSQTINKGNVAFHAIVGEVGDKAFKVEESNLFNEPNSTPDFTGLKTSVISKPSAHFAVLHGQIDTKETDTKEDTKVKAQQLLSEFNNVDKVNKAFEERMEELEKMLGSLKFSIPLSKNIEAMVNYWLTYQIYIVHILARSALYQSGGAYGYRDQSQSMMGLLSTGNSGMWKRGGYYLETLCRHQFEKGDVQTWWHEHSGQGQRSIISDPPLWLPLYLIKYLEATGDTAICNFKVPFILQDPLIHGQRDKMEVAKYTNEKYEIYEHSKRAINLDLDERMGEHGVPLFGGGDWNDALDQVGDHEKGESSFNAFLLLYILPRFADIADQQGDHDFAKKCRAHAVKLQEAIDEHLWNGKYYIRGFDKEGKPLEFCDVVVQSWAAMALGNDNLRARKAVKYAVKHLYKPKEKLILLFDKILTTEKYGKITKYALGIRENLAQYTHGATWLVTAFIEILKGLKKDLNKSEEELKAVLDNVKNKNSAVEILRYLWLCGVVFTKTRQYTTFGDTLKGLLDCFSPMDHATDERYGGEPYLVAADIYGGKYFDIIIRQLFGLVIRGHIKKAFGLIAFIRKQGYDRRGECGWTGYTGSPSWINRNLVEGVLGIRFSGGKKIMIEPCIPREWDGYSLVYENRDKNDEKVLATYNLKIENPHHVFQGVVKITVDGKEINASEGIPLLDQGEHNVIIEMGPAFFSLRAALRDLLNAVFEKSKTKQTVPGNPNVDVHIVSSLQDSIDTFHSAVKDENGTIHTNIYLRDRLPENPEDMDLQNTGIMVDGKPVWASTKAGALVLFMDPAGRDIHAVADSVNESIKAEGKINGSGRVVERLKGLFKKVNADLDLTGLQPGIIVDHTATGRKIYYNEQGSMVVTADLFMDDKGETNPAAISAKLGELMTIRNAESVAMPQNIYINLDGLTNREDFLDNLEAFNKAGNRQMIVDPSVFEGLSQDRIGAITELARKSGVKIYINLTAKERDQELNEAKEHYEKFGFPGYAVIKDGRAVIFDFLSGGQGVNADVIAFMENEEPSLEKLKQKIRQSRTSCKVVNLSDIKGLLKGGERSIIDRVALTEILKTTILSLYNPKKLSTEYVKDVGYAFDKLPSADPKDASEALKSGDVDRIVSAMGIKGVSHCVNTYLKKLKVQTTGTEKESQLSQFQVAFLTAIVEKMFARDGLKQCPQGLADKDMEILYGQARLKYEMIKEHSPALMSKAQFVEQYKQSYPTNNNEEQFQVYFKSQMLKLWETGTPEAISTIIELIPQLAEKKILERQVNEEILFNISSVNEVLKAA